jgi:ParB family chromosome partitioning protein
MAKAGMLKEVLSRTGTQDSRSVNIQIRDIPIGDIAIRENIRKDSTTGIEDLAESLRQHGLLQPITVYTDGDKYIVKTGHRRFKACQRLYQTERERFHSIRCIISNAENIAVIQLVENVQRENLSQIDLYNALCALKEQGMSNRQIAEVIGKAETYVKYLFVGVKEIRADSQLEAAVSYAGITIQDVAETKGIPDENTRLEILEQRSKGRITRAEMRHKAKTLKKISSARKETAAVSSILCQPRTAAAIAKERLDRHIREAIEDQGMILPSGSFIHGSLNSQNDIKLIGTGLSVKHIRPIGNKPEDNYEC